MKRVIPVGLFQVMINEKDSFDFISARYTIKFIETIWNLYSYWPFTH